MFWLPHHAQESVTLKRLLRCFLLIAVSPLINLSAHADNRGVSFIGQMCHKTSDCSVVKHVFDNAEIINTGWLYGTFNATGCKCAPTILSDPRPKRVRLSICNGTCFPERGRRCHRFECFAGMNHRQATIAIAKRDPQLLARIDKIIAMAKADMASAAAPVEWFIQPCLECSIPRTARRRLTSYIAAQFPGLPIVDNPATDKCFPDYICEKHGVVRGNSRTIIDLDGHDYSRINKSRFWRINRKSLMALAWKPCLNGEQPGRFRSPLSRRAFCTAEDLSDIRDAL